MRWVLVRELILCAGFCVLTLREFFYTAAYLFGLSCCLSKGSSSDELLCIVHCASFVCSSYSVSYTVYRILHIVYCVSYTVYRILCIVYCISYTVYRIMYIAYCVSYIVCLGVISSGYYSIPNWQEDTSCSPPKKSRGLVQKIWGKRL